MLPIQKSQFIAQCSTYIRLNEQLLRRVEQSDRLSESEGYYHYDYQTGENDTIRQRYLNQRIRSNHDPSLQNNEQMGTFSFPGNDEIVGEPQMCPPIVPMPFIDLSEGSPINSPEMIFPVAVSPSTTNEMLNTLGDKILSEELASSEIIFSVDDDLSTPATTAYEMLNSLVDNVLAKELGSEENPDEVPPEIQTPTNNTYAMLHALGEKVFAEVLESQNFFTEMVLPVNIELPGEILAPTSTATYEMLHALGKKVLLEVLASEKKSSEMVFSLDEVPAPRSNNSEMLRSLGEKVLVEVLALQKNSVEMVEEGPTTNTSDMLRSLGEKIVAEVLASQKNSPQLNSSINESLPVEIPNTMNSFGMFDVKIEASTIKAERVEEIVVGEVPQAVPINSVGSLHDEFAGEVPGPCINSPERVLHPPPTPFSIDAISQYLDIPVTSVSPFSGMNVNHDWHLDNLLDNFPDSDSQECLVIDTDYETE